MFVKIATKWEKKDYQVFSTGVWSCTEEIRESFQAFNLYKAVRVFNPLQLPSVTHEISEYTTIASLNNPSPELLQEWLMYTQYSEILPTPFSLPDFWSSVKDRFPLLAAIASEMIWMPVTSVEAETS